MDKNKLKEYLNRDIPFSSLVCGWIGWVMEIPGVNCQEKTHEKLLESLKITLKEALKFNRHDALMTVGNDYREEQIAI